MLIQKPNSLNDSFEFTFDFEHVTRIRGNREMVFTCGFCERPHEESSCRVMERMRALWRHSGKKEDIDMATKDLLK